MKMGIIALVVCATVGRPMSLQSLQAPLPTEWSNLLAAFVRHDGPSRSLIDKMAQTSRNVSVRNLAAVLKQEWDLPRGDDSFKHPRSVFVPSVPPANAKASTEVFVLQVAVTEDGRVSKAVFTKSTEQTELSEEVLERAKRALFRPAYQQGVFVAGEAILRYTVELR